MKMNENEKKKAQEFGERLEEFRKNYKLSIRQLAKEIEVSKQTVCNWEHGDILPSIFACVRLADFFHAPPIIYSEEPGQSMK